jgi:hypothetical protein
MTLICAKTDHLRSYAYLKGALSWLFANPDHGFKWLAIDTLDWLESLIHQDVAERRNKAHFRNRLWWRLQAGDVSVGQSAGWP